ncbi:hypothetical protein V6N11_001517 [Hibiscus sabdariffa]|uniref:Uncharacterized protein n=1 Tax=Hibiscus sabdariffa TaxID=183260 RepID=A0ABR2S0C3_9ROSI
MKDSIVASLSNLVRVTQSISFSSTSCDHYVASPIELEGGSCSCVHSSTLDLDLEANNDVSFNESTEDNSNVVDDSLTCQSPLHDATLFEPTIKPTESLHAHNMDLETTSSIDPCCE